MRKPGEEAKIIKREQKNGPGGIETGGKPSRKGGKPHT